MRDVIDPYSIPPNLLMRARNVYLPEPGSGVGAYARPGFRLKNTAAPLNAGAYGQAIASASVEDGTFYNFFACGGKLYRSDAALAVFTDVTPAGVTIDASARVYITPFSNRIIVNDDVNVPWVGSDLASTPITGTEIQYNNVLPGGAWKAYGPAVIYQDAPFFVVRERDGEGVDAGTPQLRVARIAWGFTDDPFTGYRQTDYDFEWDVIQNGANPIYALWATNLAIYYFRNNSIGMFTGDVGPDLKTTATHDAVDQAIGTRAPASFAAFANALYFVDELGRPQRFVIGKGLDPIWKQLRRVVPNPNAIYPAYTATTACGAIVPELDLYVVAIYAPDASLGLHQYPTILYAFDAATGRYVGEWTIAGGCAVHAIGTVVTANGERRLAVVGTKVAPASPQPAGDGGYVWVLAGISDGIWTDGDEITETVPDIFVTTPPLGYQADLELTVDRVVAIVSEQAGDTTPKTIEIVPTGATIDVGETQQFTAIVRNGAGVALDLQPDLWVSSAPTVASINASGLATGNASGPATATANITAQLTLYGLVSNTAVLTVVDPSVPVSIEVTPTDATINVGLTQQLTAIVRNAHGDILVDYPIDAWDSSDATKASVDGDGLVTGAAVGSTNVTASIAVPALTSNASTITVVDQYAIHTFSINDTFIVSQGAGDIQVLLVGGGGGGGGATGTGVGVGGGGGGGFVESTQAITPGSYPVTVGQGGQGGRPDTSPAPTIDDGHNGSDSVFRGVTAVGGGGGSAIGAGHNGGSGGGGRCASGDFPAHSFTTDYVGAGTAGQGHDSGRVVFAADSYTGQETWGSGGGGAGEAGHNGGVAGMVVGGFTGSTGAGGNGQLSNIPHVPTTFGGGGGASPAHIASGGSAGGSGGGGAGNGAYVPGTGGFGGAGTNGLGGGGGAGGGDSSGFAGTPIGGGNGGNGVVVIRYLLSTGIVATGGAKFIY